MVIGQFVDAADGHHGRRIAGDRSDLERFRPWTDGAD